MPFYLHLTVLKVAYEQRDKGGPNSQVNKLLEKSYKSYIKKVACYPERISYSDFEFTDFLPSEKIHINLLVLESRFQAILLYATRSIVSYMNRCNSGS